METDELEINSRCVCNQSFCSSTNGMLVWNVHYESQKPNNCAIASRSADLCWISRTGLVCPSLDFSFLDHAADEKPQCGAAFGFGRATVQRYYYTNMIGVNVNQLDTTLKIKMKPRFQELYEDLSGFAEKRPNRKNQQFLLFKIRKYKSRHIDRTYIETPFCISVCTLANCS